MLNNESAAPPPIETDDVDLQTGEAVKRTEGCLPIEQYGVLGEGRSIALTGSDGSIDWWCVPNMDSPPLFDRLLDPENGGCFVIEPVGEFTVNRRYRPSSNVLDTIFTTASGRARLTESLNSGTAGRLPWDELARRIEGLEGEVEFNLLMRPGRRGDTVNPYRSTIGPHTVFHVGRVLGLLLHDDGIVCEWSDTEIRGRFSVTKGDRRVAAIIAGQDEPLVVPSIEQIDERIDISDREWRRWTDGVSYDGADRDRFLRSALALKLLLYSPSGAIAAAGTTSLPEGIGGEKNYDYRYAWVRDAGYTIKAYLAADAEAEAKAAFTWLLNQLRSEGARVCYALDGGPVPDESHMNVAGYRGSQPVRIGNRAGAQRQHGVYGDIFETASCFVAAGNIIDSASAETLSHLADQCADAWRLPDAGIWELPEEQHFTMSKISCWQALQRAVELADQGQLPTTCRDRWARERQRIFDWIEENCWSEERQAFVMYPGSDMLDASLALAVRFGFDGRERLEKTMAAINAELGRGALHYRYSGMDKVEGCFLACSFWMVEALAALGHRGDARRRMLALNAHIDRGVGVLSEMIDPDTGAYLGNLPQGLSHLAHIMALSVLDGEGSES
ncbi:glycoside hydrolase family 15 protein [Croceicoccus mobilis]|uniref:Glycoside hydrolase family 15 n=1 Tax=Croceicoccus mobilis TaxID=1703339 RepID=A0A917DVI5_9SPHN|nr:glycoside hydrolase family 15 protein [Croceicoccus mobilis]GGD74474.1 glycoside hydrolase family 15 [Croceicoccus mobilis]